MQESLLDYGDREEEELRRIREAAAAEVKPPPMGYAPPPAAPAPAAQGYAPPPEMTAAGEMAAMNTFGSVLPQMRDLQAGMQAAGEFPIPAGAPNLTPAGLEDVQSPQGSLRAQLLQQPEPQGFVPTLPQGETVSPVQTALQVAAGPMQVYEGLNVEVPYVSPALQEIVPYAINSIPGIRELGVVSDLVGGPDPGQTLSSLYGDQYGVLDIGTIIAPGIGDVPVTSIVQNARGYADNIARAALPTPTGYAGLGSPAMGPGDMEAVLRARGMSTEDIAQFYVNNNASPPGTIENAVQQERIAAQQAYPEGGTPAARLAAAQTYDSAINGPPQPPPIADDAYDTGQAFGYNPASPNFTALPPSPYDAIPDEIVDELALARQAADEDALMARGLAGGGTPGQSAPLVAPDVVAPSATPPPASPLTGGGTGNLLPASPGGLASQPPPASLSVVPPWAQGVGGFPPVQNAPPSNSQRISNLIQQAQTGPAPYRTPPPGVGGFPPGKGPALPPPPTPPPPGGAGGFPPGQGPAPPPPAGGTPPTPPAAATPAQQSAWDKGFKLLTDTLYTAFGGDIGVLMRQDVTSFLNPFRIPETIRVIQDAGSMFRGKAEAMVKIDELKNLVDQASAKIDPKFRVNLQLPDIPGVIDNKGFLSRDVGGPGVFGKIPVVNAPVNALSRANAAVLYSRRVHEYLNFVDNLPNKAFQPENLKHTKAAAQHFADMRAVFGGRGSLGPRDVENFLQHFGPLFTSLRYAVSMPERLPYLVPIQYLGKGQWDVFGPAWRNAVAEHAGFAVALAPIYLAAEQAGIDVKPNGLIQSPLGTYYDVTGGAAGWYNTIRKVAEGDTEAAAEFVRNKVGPLPQSVIQAIQAYPGDAPEQAFGRGLEVLGIGDVDNVKDALKFLRPGYFDQGATGSGSDVDRVAALGVFLYIQDAAKAFRNTQGDTADKALAAGITGGLGFFGVGGRTYPPYVLTQLREGVQNDPRLPDLIRGIDYDKLGSDGKKAVDALIEADKPEEYKEGIKQRDENPNSNPAFADYRARSEAIDKQESERKTQIYDALRSGQIDGAKAREGRALVASAANSARDAARNDPEFKKAVSELEKNDVNTYLDAYFKIADRVKGPDGKPDWDAVRQKQEEFLKFVEGQDATVGRALRYEAETKKGADNMLDALYVQAQPLLQKYFGDIKSDYARAEAQRNNPRDDAFLALLGYGKTQSPEAARILQQMIASLPASGAAPVAAAPSGAQRSIANVPPAPSPQQPVAPIATGARLPPVAPGEFNSPTASPQQRQNFINAMATPANAYAYTGIPPSVWAAMGASESNWGRAPSVFGIKGVGSAGGANLATHEVYGGQKVNINDQFAAYNNLDDAFNHFIDLTSHGRYANAWANLQQTGDWQGFLRGITNAGYATDKSWPDSIISLASHIEKTYPHINRR